MTPLQQKLIDSKNEIIKNLNEILPKGSKIVGPDPKCFGEWLQMTQELGVDLRTTMVYIAALLNDDTDPDNIKAISNPSEWLFYG